MSSRCPCQFSDHVDTILGAHKDPISSEKCWLDYMVRELSRVVAGKGRGQEAVWRAQCQPTWWESVCPLPWKNPTTNPKDKKDTLNAKFECLVTRLRNEGKLPSELQEEIALWEKGRMSEVFLMTSYSSLLGQASNLHATLQMTQDKLHETGISVQLCILDDLQSCLSACVDKVNAMKIKIGDTGCVAVAKNITRCSGRKRHHDDSQSESEASQPTSKRFNLPTGGSPLFSPSSSPPLSYPSSSSPPLSSPSSSSPPLSSPSSSSSPPLSSPSSSSSPSPPPALFPSLSPPQCNSEQLKLVLVTLKKQLQVKSTAAATPIAQHQPLQNTVTAVSSRNASNGVAAPVDLVPPSVANSHNPDPMGEKEIIESYSDLFNLVFDDDYQLSDFDDLLIMKSPEMCSESETSTENIICQMVPSPVSHSPDDTFNPNCSVSNSNVFFSSNTVVQSEVSNVSGTATDGGSPQGALLVSSLHSGLEDIDSIEEEFVCESGYSSDGSASLRSSLDSTFPFPDFLETFLESWKLEH